MLLGSRQTLLGEAFDYAINICHIPGQEFMEIFAASTLCRRLENREIIGQSGIELVLNVLREITGKEWPKTTETRSENSSAYWMGWGLGAYQQQSGRTFQEIFQAIPYKDLERMYFMLHEADISKFIDIAEKRVKSHFPETRLKYQRLFSKYTQQELAHTSGVSLRSIQMYEQRHKNINKASAETLYRLAKSLHCHMEDLLEKEIGKTNE